MSLTVLFQQLVINEGLLLAIEGNGNVVHEVAIGRAQMTYFDYNNLYHQTFV